MRFLPLCSCALLAAFSLSCKETPPPKPQPPAQAASRPAEKPGNTPDTRNHVDADGVVRRGEKLSDAETISVADAMAKAPELDGKVVKLTGTVGKVCAKKGCWFVIADGDQHIRITSKGYKFFVPESSIGMVATIEGDLEVKELSQEDAEHLAAEGAPLGTGGPQREVSVAAIGVELAKKKDG